MESEQKNWLQRLMDRMKSGKVDGSGLPAVGSDGLIVEPAGGDGDSPEKGLSLSRWAKRENAIAQLQEGYERVNQLIADMQKHMADQSQRTERMCSAVEQLARGMADVPELSREQAHTLQTIAGQLEASNTASRQLAEVVGEIPKVARAQSEAMVGIGRRIEMMNEQSVVGNQTMEKLNSAISSVGQTGQAQTDLLRHIDARANEHNERLTQMLEGEGQRFTILVVIAVILGLVATAASVLILWMR